MSAERFSRLKFKIHGYKGWIWGAYPPLLGYPAIKAARKVLTDKQLDISLRYIIYLYDKNSELLQEISDLNERKDEARILAGITKADVDIIKGFDERGGIYMNLILCFLLEIYHGRKVSEWHTTLQEIDDITKVRWKKLDEASFVAKQRADLNNLVDQLHEKADRLEEEIFSDNEDIKKMVIVDRWSSPERYAAPTLKLING